MPSECERLVLGQLRQAHLSLKHTVSIEVVEEDAGRSQQEDQDGTGCPDASSLPKSKAETPLYQVRSLRKERSAKPFPRAGTAPSLGARAGHRAPKALMCSFSPSGAENSTVDQLSIPQQPGMGQMVGMGRYST